MNLMAGEVVATGAETVVRLAAGGVAHAHVPTSGADKGKTVNVGFRPEDLNTTSAEDYLFAGHVNMTEALGEVTLLHFDPLADEVPVVAKLPGVHAGLRGENERLTADPSKVHLFDSAGRSLLYATP